jgi:hypothetical protein
MQVASMPSPVNIFVDHDCALRNVICYTTPSAEINAFNKYFLIIISAIILGKIVIEEYFHLQTRPVPLPAGSKVLLMEAW